MYLVYSDGAFETIREVDLAGNNVLIPVYTANSAHSTLPIDPIDPIDPTDPVDTIV